MKKDHENPLRVPPANMRAVMSQSLPANKLDKETIDYNVLLQDDSPSLQNSVDNRSNGTLNYQH